MPKKIEIVDLLAAVPVPVPWDLDPEEMAAIIAQYKAERTLEAVERDYADFEKQVAEGVPAEDLLKELKEDSSIE